MKNEWLKKQLGHERKNKIEPCTTRVVALSLGRRTKNKLDNDHNKLKYNKKLIRLDGPCRDS